MKLTTILKSTLLSTAIVGLGGAAFAAGTVPGTIISNTIDLSYSSGGNTITRLDEAEISFVVDRKVDFTLEGQDASALVTVAQGASEQQLTFRLVNEGNDTSGYDIDVSSSGDIGLTYDASGAGASGTYSVYIGTTSDPVSAADTLYDTAGTLSLGDLGADGEIFIKIVTHVPSSSIDGQSDSFTVTGTALDAGTNTITTETATPDINTVDTFFADTDLDGIEFDTEDFVVSAPVLTALKTSTLVSENISGTFDCLTGAIDPAAEAFVPGACVEYTLSVTNDAGASSAATSLSVVDALPGQVTFVSVHANSGFDSVTEAGGTITATAASLPAGATAETVIRVTID